MPNTKGVWTKALEDALNEQINLELHASYVYMAMGHFFKRSDVALGKIGDYFLKCSQEENEHANKMMHHQNKRLGTIRLKAIEPPAQFEPSNFTLIKGMQGALALEETVNKALLELHDNACNDPEFSDFLESEFLHEQVDAIHQLKGYIRNLERCGEGLGEFLFDKHFSE